MAALDGIVVLDLTHVVAGPFCTMMMGDQGANVIKVERPGKGDHIRAWPPSWNGTASAFLALNRNKRSIAIDFQQPRGADVVRALAAKADVVVESFRPGSLAKHGLAYEQIRELNPRVIYCSISGYGQTGPLAELGGYDLIAQAFGGLMSTTGQPEGPSVRAGYSVVDTFAGMSAYGAVMTALLQRERTGQGQYVETSLLDAVVAQMSYHATGYLATGKIPGRLGTASPSLVPYQQFQSADADFIMGCNNDVSWRRLCTALARPDLATDPRFTTNADRLRNKELLIGMLSEIFRTQSATHWVTLFNAHQVPSSRINTVADVVHDEQVAARDLLPAIPHPAIPDLRAPATPFKLVGASAAPIKPPPGLGEHSGAILEELGFSIEDVEALRSAGVVG
ncbi:MAG: L-carnitine dehydratase/bile acid-inducible protein [Myxococcales bacterium]|nr:L-carnitine dehydratase/bile acid-inducible protein [Myxococcales bacterium]